MKKTIVVCVIVLLGVFAVMSLSVSAFGLQENKQSQLPPWAPKKPSAQFIRAAKVLETLPGILTKTPLLVANWECFGLLTDQQIKDFMQIQEVKQEAAGRDKKMVDFMKENWGAVEANGFIIYKMREVCVPVNTMSRTQRKALDKAMSELKKLPKREKDKDPLAKFYESGAKKDLSNVELVFTANGGTEVSFSLLAWIDTPEGIRASAMGTGTFARIRQ